MLLFEEHSGRERRGFSMRRLLFTLLIFLATAVSHSDPGTEEARIQGNSLVHHDLKVSLDPQGHRFAAEDRITIPQSSACDLHFSLHKGLEPVSLTPGVTVVRKSGNEEAVPLETYSLTLPPGINTFVLKFGGEVHHPLAPAGNGPARGARDTPGIISKEGVFLSGSTHWYPQFGEELITFDLEVKLPSDWDAVSQGERTLHEIKGGSKQVQWHCPYPQEEIFVVAAPFFEFSRPTEHVQAMVFLREQDKDLAEKYLLAAGRYIGMYDRLIGPYPYKKFALVENFWETGYGMPSFTLMGPKVIRFPFIIDSSYPHEILHNWWGNGVFPDPESGNWSEGLTAYLSDHFIQEQRGTASQYRRDTLQKYSDYVSKEKDFPLSEFRSRHNSATEAIGYGKALMFFHMLQMQLGDKDFVKALREFYRDRKFKFASFDDIRKSFETVSGKDLRRTFAQWVDKHGAPQLKISNTGVRKEGDEYVVQALLEQVQDGRPYLLNVPVAITAEGRDQAYQGVVRMTKKRKEVKFRLFHAPLRIDVDPEFDLFRRLAREEIPPALTQAFGAKKLTIIIPSSASDALAKAYRLLAQSWTNSGPEEVRVIDDSEIAALPTDTSVIIPGWENRFLREMPSELAKYGVRMDSDSLTIGKETFPRTHHSVAITIRNPKSDNLSLTWIASDTAEAIRGLARKLPHYHSYSYLVFKGEEPTFVAKGYWPPLQSPLTVFVPRDGGCISRVEMGKLKTRKPLATLQ
jgi:aminopeptidase N